MRRKNLTSGGQGRFCWNAALRPSSAPGVGLGGRAPRHVFGAGRRRDSVRQTPGDKAIAPVAVETVGKGPFPTPAAVLAAAVGGRGNVSVAPPPLPWAKWEGGCAKEREEGWAVSARLFFCGKVVSLCAAGAKGKQTENARALRTGETPQAG